MSQIFQCVNEDSDDNSTLFPLSADSVNAITETTLTQREAQRAETDKASIFSQKEIEKFAPTLSDFLHDKKNYITNEINSRALLTINDDDPYGRRFYQSFKSHEKGKVFSYHAIRLLSFPAGEADCERAISKSRYIYNDTRQKQIESTTHDRIIVGCRQMREQQRKKGIRLPGEK